MREERVDVERQVPDYRRRSVQIVAAIPSCMLWALLTAIAVVWCAGTVAILMAGKFVLGDWRFPYLCVVLTLVLIGAPITVKTLWRAYKGRSPLWWHGATFALGAVFLGMLGIVGD